jgi:hypothetical protein
MISSTVLTLVVVPVFYLGLDDLGEWIRAKLWDRTPQPQPEPAAAPRHKPATA